MLSSAISWANAAFQDFNRDQGTTATLAIGIAVFAAVYWWITSKRYRLPPGPRGLPVLGYLPFLGKEPYKPFQKLSERYGSVFGLYMGQTYAVVLGDYETVKNAFNHPATLGRPADTFDFLPDGAGFVTSNSAEWAEQRRFSVRAMRDIGLGGSKWEALIQEEIDDIVHVIEQRNGQPDDYWPLLCESMGNNIMTLVFGKRLPAGDPARHLVERTIHLAMEAGSISSLKLFFPAFLVAILAKLGFGFGQKQELHSKLVEFTAFLNKQVDERKKVYKNENLDIFIDGYLNEIDNNSKDYLNNTFNERNLRGNITTLLAAGTDTTTVSVMWLLLAMAQYPDIQAKVHRELDAVLGKDGRVKYSERNKVPYTYAAMQEAQRWMTIAPLSTVREASEDFKINGYDVPKGTLIIPNLYAIHKNPKSWKEPEKFIPERFLSNDGQQLVAKTDGYIPFSIGKRNCPGETVAKITTFLYFATLMQKFKVLSPVGKSPNLKGIFTLVYSPVHQNLRFVLRE